MKRPTFDHERREYRRGLACFLLLLIALEGNIIYRELEPVWREFRPMPVRSGPCTPGEIWYSTEENSLSACVLDNVSGSPHFQTTPAPPGQRSFWQTKDGRVRLPRRSAV